MSLKLKAVHRLILRSVVDSDGKSGNHSLSDLNKMLKLLDLVSFSEEETKRLNIRLDNGAVRWDTRLGGAPDGEEVDLEKELEISDEQKDLLKEIIKRKNDAKEFSLSEATPVTDVASQLGLEL